MRILNLSILKNLLEAIRASHIRGRRRFRATVPEEIGRVRLGQRSEGICRVPRQKNLHGCARLLSAKNEMISVQAIPSQRTHVGDSQPRKPRRKYKRVNFRPGSLRFLCDPRHLVRAEWYLLRAIDLDSPKMGSRVLGNPSTGDCKFENASKPFLFFRFRKDLSFQEFRNS